eukprot:SAG31_NODE_2579_length_5438_cov_17.092527_4_plen_117_part_00
MGEGRQSLAADNGPCGTLGVLRRFLGGDVLLWTAAERLHPPPARARLPRARGGLLRILLVRCQSQHLCVCERPYGGLFFPLGAIVSTLCRELRACVWVQVPLPCVGAGREVQRVAA